MDNKQRAQERIPYHERIMINSTITVQSIDISKGGLYVHTDHPFQAGSVVEISLPIDSEELKIKARIKYEHAGVGIGLRFIDLDDIQKAKIEELIEDIKRKPPMPKRDKPGVLLVDDNTMSRKIMKSELSLEGFWVVEATNGIDAIKALEEQPVDIVVIDLFMDKTDGFEVLSAIRGSPEWKDIPLIVLSKKYTDDVRDAVTSAGADDFLLKMVTPPSKLAEVLRKFLQQKTDADRK